MAARTRQARTWARRAMLLLLLGVLAQVGLVLWRVNTRPLVPARAGLVIDPGGDPGRDVFVKHFAAITECHSPGTYVRGPTIQPFLVQSMYRGVPASRATQTEPPAWHTPPSDARVRRFASRATPIDDDGALVTISAFAVGWPLECFRGERVYDGMLEPGVSAWHRSSARSGLAAPGCLRLPGMDLPLTPIWPSLLANAALVALPGLLALALLDARRARRRVLAGQCQACRYDRRGVPEGSPCPECGHA